MGAAQLNVEADKNLATLGFCNLTFVRWPDRGGLPSALVYLFLLW